MGPGALLDPGRNQLVERVRRCGSHCAPRALGASRGSVFTVREAIRAKPAAVVLAGAGAERPRFSGGRWAPCSVGPVAAFRWVADAPEPDGGEPKPTALQRARVWGVERHEDWTLNRSRPWVIAEILGRAPAAAQAARDETEGVPAGVLQVVDSRLAQLRSAFNELGTAPRPSREP
jgi:hypothetical protein